MMFLVLFVSYCVGFCLLVSVFGSLVVGFCYLVVGFVCFGFVLWVFGMGVFLLVAGCRFCVVFSAVFRV